MAFIGTPVVKQISDRKCRVTGLSLGGGEAGTIGLHGSTLSPGVVLPASFKPSPYQDNTLVQSIAVSFVPVTHFTAALAVDVVKSGNDNLHFLATLTNSGEVSSPELEIYVEFH